MSNCINYNHPDFKSLRMHVGSKDYNKARANLFINHFYDKTAKFPSTNQIDSYFKDLDFISILQAIPDLTLKGTLEYIASIDKSPLVKRLLENIPDNVANTKVVIQDIVNIPLKSLRPTFKAAGVYDGDMNEIRIAKYSFNKKKLLLLHEIIHSYTFNILRSHPNKDYIKIYEFAKSQLPPSYPLTNIDEFTTGVFTNPLFINQLKSLPPIGVKSKNLWEDLWSIIARVLNLKTPSLYQEAFNIAGDIIEEAKLYIADLDRRNAEVLASEVETPTTQVQELFESNLTLANSVYEVLGFNNLASLSNEDSEKVDKIFKKYPKLASLFNNNKELYNSYLKSIFPNSSEEFKGKLFFHGTKNPIEGGKFKISDRSLAKGLWFTKQLGYAKRIESYKSEGDTPITYGVILNINNPKHFYDSSGALLVQRPSDFEKEYNRKNNDAVVFHHPESSDGKFTNKGGYNQVVIFDENLVHIIGDENDIIKAKEFLANDMGLSNLITPNDKIIFGHPGIGKTYLKESGRTDVIDFDSDYKTKINEKFNLPKGFKARNDFQKSNKEEYQKAVRELWIEAKQEVKRAGKQLFASDMILLREFASDFDKVITISKDTFVNRAKQRNDYTEGETEKWKTSLDTEISKIDKTKVINTDKYLSDLFITRRNAEVLASEVETPTTQVQELFESNPELANAVYSALGFENKIENPNNIILKEEKTNNSSIGFSITGDNNLKGGVTLYKDEEEKIIYVHDIGINIKNKGYGTTIYNLLAEKFNKEGYTLGSTSAIYTKGTGGRKVWDKLVKQGKTIIIEKPLTEAQQQTNEIRKKTGNTELIEKNLEYRYINNQITQQQKQQALQLYSQYLESLNKPNTNPVLQVNRLEQVKKFAELQERLNNEEFLKSAKFAYESSEGLKDFGTQEQYNDYIARVSLGILKNPSSGEYNYTSKVKDIVYHGTPFDFDSFKKPLDVKENIFNQHTLLKKEDNPDAIYFQFEAKPFRQGKVIPAIINSKELIKKENYSGYSISYATGNRQKLEQQLNSKTFDALDITPIQGIRELLVFKPEQIHILGSKQDIDGFKNFVKNEIPNDTYLQRDARGRVTSIDNKEEAIDYLKQNGVIGDKMFKGNYWIKKVFPLTDHRHRDSKSDYIRNNFENIEQSNLRKIESYIQASIDQTGYPAYTVRRYENGYTVSVNDSFFNRPSQQRLFHLVTKEASKQKVASDSTLTLVKSLAEKLGITIEENNEIVKKYGAYGVAHTVSKLIEIAEGKENVALTEEFFHIVVALLPKETLDNLLGQIEKVPNYQYHYEQYKNLYNGDDSKIKKEILAKYLADVLIYELEKPTDFVSRVWQTIKNWFKNLFNNVEDFKKVVNGLLNDSLALNQMATEEETYLHAVTDTDIDEFETYLSTGERAKDLTKYVENDLIPSINKLWQDTNSSGFLINNIRSIQTKANEINTETIRDTVEGFIEYIQYLGKAVPTLKSEFEDRSKKQNLTNTELYDLYHGFNITNKIQSQLKELKDILDFDEVDKNSPLFDIINKITKDTDSIISTYYDILKPMGLQALVDESATRNANYLKIKEDEKARIEKQIAGLRIKLNSATAPGVINANQKQIDKLLKKKESIDKEIEANIVTKASLKTLLSEDNGGKFVRRLSQMFGGVSMSPNAFVQSMSQLIRRGLREHMDNANEFAKDIKQITDEHFQDSESSNLSEKTRYKNIFREATKISFNPKTLEVKNEKISVLPSEWLITEYNNKLSELSLKILQLKNQSAPQAEIDKAIEEKVNYQKLHGERFYTDKYYEIYDLLIPQASEALQAAQEFINEWDASKPAVGNASEMQLWIDEKLRRIEERQRLESYYDRLGNLKTNKDDIAIAKSIAEWRKAKRDGVQIVKDGKTINVSVDEYYTPLNRYNHFLQIKEEVKQRYAKAVEELDSETITQDQFDIEQGVYDDWFRDNVTVTFTKKFEDERTEIYDEISKLSKQLPDSDNEDIKELWTELHNLTKGFRNPQTGQLDSSRMTPELIAKSKDIEESIERIKEYIRTLPSESLTDAEIKVRGLIAEQFNKLGEIQNSKHPTDAFNLRYNQMIAAEFIYPRNVYGGILVPGETARDGKTFTEAMAAANVEARVKVMESQWYKDNTITVQKYNEAAQGWTSVVIPLYVNRVLVPIETIEGEYLDREAPSMVWKKRKVNQEFINKSYKDIAGNYIPKSDDYKNKSWFSLSQQDQSFIKKLTEKYFESQTKVAKYQRLGYELPYVESKMATRLLNSISTKNIFQYFTDTWDRLKSRFTITSADLAEEFGDITTTENDKAVSGAMFLRYSNYLAPGLRSYNVPALISIFNMEAEQMKWKRENIHKLAAFEYIGETAKNEQTRNQVQHYLKATLKGQISSHSTNQEVNLFIKMMDGLKNFSNFFKLAFNSNSLIKSLATNISQIFTNMGYNNISVENAGKNFMWSVAQAAEVFMNDFNVNKTLMGELAMYFRAIQGDTFEEAYRTIGRKQIQKFNVFNYSSIFLKLPDITTSLWMLKLASDNFLVDVDGKKVPILEAYEIVDNKLVLKPNASVTEEQVNDFRKVVEVFIKTTAGNYDPTDIMLVKRTILGRLFMNFGSYLPQQLHRAYGKKTVLPTGEEFEGYIRGLYRTTKENQDFSGMNQYQIGRFMNNMIPFLTNSLYPISILTSKGYTPEQKRHALAFSKSMTTTLSIAYLTYIISVMAKESSGDDEEYKWWLYLQARSSAEEIINVNPLGIANKYLYRPFYTAQFKNNNIAVSLAWTIASPFLSTIIPQGATQWSMSPYGGNSEWYSKFGNNPMLLNLIRSTIRRPSYLYPQESVEGQKFFNPQMFEKDAFSEGTNKKPKKYNPL